MKRITKLSFTVIACFIGYFTFSQSATLVANNNPGAPTGTNVYPTLTAALTAATPGDIIYVVPSSISYGDITITKSITIFGAGLRPDKNLPIKSKVNYIYIDASNVRVSGLIGSSEWRLGSSISNTTISNITIENCRFPGMRHYSTTVTVGNLLFRNNVINMGGSNGLDFNTTSSVIVTNNVIITLYGSSLYGIEANGITFSNNIFRYEGTSGTNDGQTFENVDNCLFEFNIFYGSSPALPDAGSVNNVFNYNLSYGNSVNTFPSTGSNGTNATGNVEGGDPLFTNFPLGKSWDNSFNLSLGAGSPALNIDGSGTNAGVTGGATPWDSDGSLLPTVQSISIPAVVPVGSDLNVNVKGKGN